jgi:SAM-dependent MidA family methyltransferase
MASASTELERKLIERISRDGPITFRDFMQAALYDPELGYYNTERLKIGATGDYYTSSNVHPAFGAVLAQSLVELWVEYPLTLVEIGAGTGQLASDILSAIRDENRAVFENLTYIIVETSSHMIKRQQKRLKAFGGRLQWRELHELERAPILGIAFSNEFVDALPVHRIRLEDGIIEEQYVTLSSEQREQGEQGEPGETRLGLAWRRASTVRLNNYAAGMNVTPAEGQVVEVNLDAVRWLARMSRAISHGFLVTIDYGDTVQHLWSRDRRQGTLRSFHKHHLIDSPLERIGEQDMTASVNFTALIEYGRDFGFQLVSYERQTAFLIRMGLIDRLASERSAPDSIEDSLDDLKGRLAVKNLFVPGGISDSFRVLIQRR